MNINIYQLNAVSQYQYIVYMYIYSAAQYSAAMKVKKNSTNMKIKECTCNTASPTQSSSYKLAEYDIEQIKRQCKRKYTHITHTPHLTVFTQKSLKN